MIVFSLATSVWAGPGEILFKAHCAPCHGPNGDGGRGANLAVARLLHAPDDAALSSVITLGIPGTQMPGTRMTAEENRDLVAYVRGLGRNGPAKTPGDRRHGEQIFWGKAACSRCHTVGARGGRMGPDLTEIGATRSTAHLLQSLVDPESDVPETFAVYRRVIAIPDNFLEVRVVTMEGKTVTGVRVNEDTFTIQIRDYSDQLHSFDKSRLEKLEKRWGQSPMPSYRDTLTAVERRDVVAYLAGLRGGE